MPDKKKPAKFGWYSKEMAERNGTVIYEKLGGGELEVTCVTSDGNHGTAWPDIRFVGEVTEYVRKGRTGSWSFLDLVEGDYDGDDFYDLASDVLDDD